MEQSSRALRTVCRLSMRLIALPVLMCCSLATAMPKGVVNTEGGAVAGTKIGGVDAFLGIPYAAPPVGDFRWRAPQAAHHWHGVLNATRYAAHCAQNPSPFGQASQSEDCLYLNVFTPPGKGREDRDRLPVMVWIHGGALVSGESDDYDPSRLVAEGVIVVTINYRLGALGFLAHSALAADVDEDGSVVVNYGLRDQQAALHWVQKNIEAFGGNKHNVTVFGESAGGLSTLSHIVSPLSQGLFAKAVVHSGAYALALPTLTQAEAAGTGFAIAIGCNDQSAQCLRSAPLASILAKQTSAAGYVPSVDGVVLPTSIGAALAAGTFNRVPVMQGSNHDEWRLFAALFFDLLGQPLTDASYAAVTNATFGPLAPLVLARYPTINYPSPDLAYSAWGTDQIFACTGRIAIRDLAQYVPVFAYEFSDPKAPEDFLPPVSFPYAAAHASELQYLFNLKTALPHAALSASQQKLAESMVDYWTRFAKDSNPNQRGAFYWPQYSPTSDEYQNLTPGAVMPEYGFAADHQCDFWTPILKAAGD